MRIGLIGQPNCGKSTLFNQIAGYKADTGNFSGTTVTFTESKVRVVGDVVDVVDLPGTYSLAGTELLELEIPMVIALNMMDEADRIGIRIDVKALGEMLGVPIIPMIATKGRGIQQLFIQAYQVGQHQQLPNQPHYSKDIERYLDVLMEELRGVESYLKPRALAIKLLEGDKEIILDVVDQKPDTESSIKTIKKSLHHERGQTAEWVINGERSGLADNLAKQVINQGKRHTTFRDRLDDILLHPFFGYIFLILILYVFFELVYSLGGLLETPLMDLFTQMEAWLLSLFNNSEAFFPQILIALVQGVSGGIAIVLPYLMPFLIGLGILEDIGYLPRVAFLMDALMHKIGLHGKSIVPFILGFGCNVPAIMSTRILEDKRERFISAALSTMVPCAARLSVVFGLVAFYLGPVVALAIYLFNLFVIAFAGRILSRLVPGESPGLIIEMPVYRIPTVRTVVNKAWWRIREFIVEAWPLLIVGSVVLAILNYIDVARYLNLLVYPLSWILGLPREVGVPLIFGILRKELSLVMLGQALGSMEFSSVLSPVQMITYTVFVVFYIPCLATMVVIRKELGGKMMWQIIGMTTLIATLASLFARGVAEIYF